MTTNAAPLRGQLDLADLKLPPWRPLQAVEVEDYVDYDGEDAVKVWFILHDDVTDEELMNPIILDVKHAVLDFLRQHGERLFPYTTFVTASDRHRTVDDSEDDEDVA